jgi:hypothetical protein
MNAKGIRIEDIDIGERFRKDVGDLEGLADEILNNQYVHAVLVSEDGDRYRLIDGYRRILAVRDILERTEIWAEVVQTEDRLHELLIQRAANSSKEWTACEKAALGMEIECEVKKLGDRRGRPLQSGSSGRQMATLHGQKTREVAAREAGFDSEQTYRRAKKVMEKGSKHLQEAIDAEIISISDAALVADEAPEVQVMAVEAVRSGRAKTATSALPRSLMEVPDSRMEKPLESAAFVLRELIREFGETPNLYMMRVHLAEVVRAWRAWKQEQSQAA